MVKVYNSENLEELRQSVAVQSALGDIPSDLAKDIQPVMEIRATQTRPIDFVKSVSAASTIYTTPTLKEDFYLVSAFISVAKDAAESGTAASLTAGVGGVSGSVLCSISSITLTAHIETIAFTPTRPVKIDRGSAIALALAGGWTTVRAQIHGFHIKKSS